MSTSHDPTDISAEFYIDGAYVSTYSGKDLTHRVRGGNGEGSIRISRGLADYQSGVSAQTAQFTLNNGDGLFTDDNANSPLYGKFGQNTRARLGVKSGGTWLEYVRHPDYRNRDSGQYVYTADKASLDITGDIDIRIEYSPAYTRGREMVLASKWLPSGNQRSWMLLTQPDGGFKFWHSPDGTFASAMSNTTTPVIDEDTTRLAVRFTLDVDNGSGSRVYTYYTSDSITGTWTSFATGTVVGTTSIFSSTTQLELGSGVSGGPIFVTADTFTGKLHAFELYSGIAGTKVADFKPNGKGLGTTSWADTCASPNTWVLSGSEIRLASDRVRITGEIITAPIDWDGTGTDVWCSMSLAGLLARYSANKAALRGSIYRSYRLNTDLTDYWPCEDSANATQIASGMTGGNPGSFFDCTFTTPTGINGSTGALTFTTGGTSYAKFLAGSTPSGTTTTAIFYFQLASLPASDKLFATLYVGTGTVRRVTFQIGTAGYLFTFYDATSTSLSSFGVLFGTGASPLNQWIGMSIQMTQSGGNVKWETQWHAVGTDIFYTHDPSGTTFAGTSGQFGRINFTPAGSEFTSAQICHVILLNNSLSIFGTSNFAEISRAWSGEVYGARLKRLCGEEGIYFQWRGDLNDTLAVGPQPADTLYNIFVAGQKVAGGILTEPRDIIGFEYITQRFLGNRRGLELDYSTFKLAGVPTPVNDTRFLVNDFTATRDGGSSARYEASDTTIRKNTADPPTGIGRWEQGETFSMDSDDLLPYLASQKVFFGTWNERRIPNLSINLSRQEICGTAALLQRVIETDIGDPINMTGLSASPLPPNDILMVIFGYVEMISNKLWSIVENTVPAGPYQVPILDDYTERDPRMDVDDSTHSILKSDITTTATSFVVKTDAASTRLVKVWVDSTNYAAEIGGGSTIDINIEGERITVTDIGTPTLTGGYNEQTFTVTRSVNGIVKAHSAGTSVSLWSPYYLGME